MPGFLLKFYRAANGQRRRIQEAETLLRSIRSGETPDNISQWIAAALESPLWEVRNIAVKLVGECGAQELCLNVASKMLGKNEIGFIRRNAACTLAKVNCRSHEIITALETALQDRYWEVRAQAALSLARIGTPDARYDSMFMEKIFKFDPGDLHQYPLWFPNRMYREKNFEVRAAFASALGALSTSESALHALKLLMQDSNWKVSESAARSAVNLAVRLHYSPECMLNILKELDLTCPDFKPSFPIRKTYNQLLSNLKAYGSDEESQ